MQEEYMLDYQNKRNLILWDYQNSPLSSKDKSPLRKKIKHIRSALRNADMRGKILLKVFSVEGDFRVGFESELSTAADAYNDFKVEFVKVRNVKIVGGNGAIKVQKEIADFELVGSKIDCMLGSPSPLMDVNIILISSDGDYSKNLAELRRRNCNIAVVIGKQPNLSLPQNADIIWEVDQFMRGDDPLYMKRTSDQIIGKIKAKGSLSRLMELLHTFNEERIKPSLDHISAAYDSGDLRGVLDEAVKFKKLKKLFLKPSEALYRFPHTSFSMCHDKKLQDFGEDLLKEVADFLIREERVREKLIKSLNTYFAALELRKRFRFLENYYLSDVIALITVMAQDLKWIICKGTGTQWHLKIIGFNLYIMESFSDGGTRTAHHDEILDRKRLRDPFEEQQEKSSVGKVAPKPQIKRKASIRIGDPESNENKLTYLAWDYISMPINAATMGIDIGEGYGRSIPLKMSDALRKAGFQGPLEIVVFAREGDVEMDVKPIFTHSDIEIKAIEYKKEDRRDALHSKMTWDASKYIANLPQKANVVLITGNVDHSSFAQKLQNNGHHVTLVRPAGERVQELNTNADLIWLFNDLIRGLPPLYNRKGSRLRRLKSTHIDDIGELLAVLSTLRMEMLQPTENNIKAKAKAATKKFNFKDTMKKAVKLGAIREEGPFFWFQNEQSWMLSL